MPADDSRRCDQFDDLLLWIREGIITHPTSSRRGSVGEMGRQKLVELSYERGIIVAIELIVDGPAHLLYRALSASQEPVDRGLVVSDAISLRRKVAHVTPGGFAQTMRRVRSHAQGQGSPALTLLPAPIANLFPAFASPEHLPTCYPHGALEIEVWTF